jgi:hypothetical protein
MIGDGPWLFSLRILADRCTDFSSVAALDAAPVSAPDRWLPRTNLRVFSTCRRTCTRAAPHLPDPSLGRMKIERRRHLQHVGIHISLSGYPPGFSLLRRRHDTATIDALEGSQE